VKTKLCRLTVNAHTRAPMSDELALTLAYEPRVAGGPDGAFGAERYPLRLDVYGTHELGGGDVRHWVIGEKSERAMRVTLHRTRVARVAPFAASGAYADGAARTPTAAGVAASTAVIVRAYATTWTKARQRCWSHAGTAVIELSELVRGGALRVNLVQNRDNDMGSSETHELLKGALVVRDVRVGAALRTLNTRNAFDIDADSRTAESAAGQLVGVINRGMSEFFGRGAVLRRPTIAALTPFHCPEFRTPRMPLPASAYALLAPTGATDVAYYEQLLDVALARSALTRDDVDALAAAPAGSYRRAALASLAVRTVTAFATSQCYLSDFLNRNVAGQRYRAELLEEDEDFKVCRLTGADDCEGCALEVHMHVRELVAAPDDAVARMSDELRAVRRLLAHYVPTLALGCVTNARMTAAELDQSAALAHTFATLLPRALVLDWAPPALRDELVGALNDYTLDAASRDLPVLIGEGTAPIDPAMRPVAAYYAANSAALRRALAAAAARRRLTELVSSELERAGAGAGAADIEVFGAPDRAAPGADFSNFYKYAVSFATPALGAARLYDWALVYARDSETRRTFGVTANDLLDASERIGTVPFLEFSEHEARVCDAVLADQQPIPVLRRARSTAARCSLCARRARFEERLAALVRDSGPPSERGTVLHARRTFVTVRERDVDDALVGALERVARSTDVQSFSYAWYTLNAAIDGTDEHNCILDVYLDF